MTNTHKIIEVLQETNEMLSTSEIAERVDGVSLQSISSCLNRMHKRDEVFKDVNREGGYSVMWQLRKTKISH